MSFFTTKVVTWGRARLPHVNVVPQQRSALANLQELADSIEGQGGLINPINVIVLKSEADAIAYEKFFRKLYGNKVKTLVFETSKSSGTWYLLVAGHRRWASIELTSPERVPLVSVSLLVPPEGATIKTVALEAALFQAAENIHDRPDTIDDASSIAVMRKAIAMSRGGGKVTIDEIARRAGRSHDTVANAIKFFSLPDFLQTPAKNKIISYGKALLLGRMYNAQFKGKKLIPEDVVRVLLKTTVANSTSESALKKIVDEYLSHAYDVANGYNMFDGDSLTAATVLESQARLASDHNELVLRTFISYLSQYARTVKGDHLLSASPMAGVYGDRVVAQTLMELANRMDSVADILHRRRALTQIETGRVHRITKRLRGEIFASPTL